MESESIKMGEKKKTLLFVCNVAYTDDVRKYESFDPDDTFIILPLFKSTWVVSLNLIVMVSIILEER